MKQDLKTRTLIFIKITIGAVIFSFGFRFFIYQHGMLSGGTSGLAMIVNQLTSLPIGMVTMALNIPMFAVAWRKLGLDFMINSTFAMVVSSALVDVFGVISFHPTDDVLLAALYGGVLRGLGLGIMYSTGVATGGGDVMVRLLRRKYQYVNLGTIMLCIDAGIVALYAIIFSRYDKAMYTVISMFVASNVVDLILYGSMNAKLCMIITDYSEAIQRSITSELHRGVTLLDGHGAYSGKNKEVILCIVKKNQMVEVRNLARSIDPSAFFVVTDVQEVFGKGFSDIMSND